MGLYWDSIGVILRDTEEKMETTIGFRVKGFRVKGFGVKGLGFKVKDFKVRDLKFKTQGSGFRI